MARMPNFFLVGAPKCGTTAISQYLQSHPQVFMCSPRETNYFCTDLDMHPGLCVRDHDAYLRLFERAGDAQVLTDASVWNLYSKVAAAKIHAFNPNAKIMITLRQPVDMMWSLHGWFLYTAAEDIVDFEQALAAQDDRREGRRIPTDTVAPQTLLYTDVVTYAPQVQRYLDAFGRDRCTVILFDDFRRDNAGVYRSLLEFLEVDAQHQPDFRVHGAAKQVRNPGLKRLFRRHPWLRTVVSRALPERARGRIGRTLAAVKPKAKQRAAKIDPDLRARLTDQFRPDIERLAALIDRDLTHWLRADSAP